MGQGKRWTRIKARAGWQASGASVEQGREFVFQTEGTWQTTAAGGAVDGDGGPAGRGRLVAAIFHDDSLTPEFPLAAAGSFTAPANGQLFLRCADAWTELGDNKGAIAVTLQCKP